MDIKVPLRVESPLILFHRTQRDDNTNKENTRENESKKIRYSQRKITVRKEREFWDQYFDEKVSTSSVHLVYINWGESCIITVIFHIYEFFY